MVVLQTLAIIISLIAVTIAAHTKYKQVQRRSLRNLVNELSDINAASKHIIKELRNARSHEDLDLELDDLSREVLKCKHETRNEEVYFILNIRSGYTENPQEIDDPERGLGALKSCDPLFLDVKVGNRDELYTTGRAISMHFPISNSRFVYKSISKIEEEHGDAIEEFSDGTLDEIEAHIDSISVSILENIIYNNPSMNVNEFDTTEEIGDHIFESIYNYDGCKKDLNELEEQIEDLEDLRRVILQASYS